MADRDHLLFVLSIASYLWHTTFEYCLSFFLKDLMTWAIWTSTGSPLLLGTSELKGSSSIKTSISKEVDAKCTYCTLFSLELQLFSYERLFGIVKALELKKKMSLLLLCLWSIHKFTWWSSGKKHERLPNCHVALPLYYLILVGHCIGAPLAATLFMDDNGLVQAYMKCLCSFH